MEYFYENELQLDGIFFDTFGEDYKALAEWHEHVGNLLSSTSSSMETASVYSFFNGLGGRNPFFNEVYSRIVEVELGDCGLGTEWREMSVNIPESEWANVKHRYFLLQTYRFPICKWLTD